MLHLIALMAATSGPFHIDDLLPGEGAESDCYTVFWRPDAKADAEGNYPHVFDVVDDTGYIKIDGKIYTLTLGQGRGTPFSPAVFAAPDGPIVIESQSMTHVDKASDGDTYHLKGKMTVSWQGQTQTLALKGETFCFNYQE